MKAFLFNPKQIKLCYTKTYLVVRHKYIQNMMGCLFCIIIEAIQMYNVYI